MAHKIIIFDMDGVLFDSIGFARSFFMKRHPGITKEMYNELHSGNYHEQAAKYSHLKIKITQEEDEKQLSEYAKKKSKTPMFEGMKELLIDLNKKGHVLVLNTNAFNKNSDPLLESAGIKHLFDFIASAEISKDKVFKFSMIQDKYGADLKNIIFITDALGDVKDAEKVGINTIAVTYGVHNKEFFERQKHPFLIGIASTVGDLKNLLERWISIK